jgi:hypothetical protein
LSEKVAGNEPISGTALHSNRGPRVIVENLVSGNGNPLCTMKNNARVRHCRVGAVNDIPADYDIAIPALPDNRRAFALLDHIARDRVSRGARRIQVNEATHCFTQGPMAQQ